MKVKIDNKHNELRKTNYSPIIFYNCIVKLYACTTRLLLINKKVNQPMMIKCPSIQNKMGYFALIVITFFI